jgi:hypothetical protein
MLGGIIADWQGKSATFVVATIICVLPLYFLRNWDRSAEASRS